jgi:allantoinase
MNHDGKRDFIGYGSNIPNPRWPNGARVAVNFVVNYEEGGEHCILDGDEHSENYLTEVYGYEKKEGCRSLFVESQFEYGSRVGIWRLLRLFDEYAIKCTALMVGLAAKKNMPLVHAIYDAGHEIAGHGYRWKDICGISRNQQSTEIKQTVEILNSVVKEGISGWYNGSCNVDTRKILVENGITYDSDEYNDDLPYWKLVENKQHLIIPYAFDTNDAKYYLPAGWSTGKEFASYLIASFDALYREGKTRPKMMTVALHSRISGHPGRAEAIREFLEYLKRINNVWVCRRDEIARHWYKNFNATESL